MRLSSLTFSVFLAVISISLGSVQTQAQDQATEPTSTVYQLESVVVTAQKTKADKQSIASSISVIDSNELENYPLAKTEDLTTFVPNLSVTRMDAFTTQYAFRGIGGMANMNKIWNTLIDGVAIPYVAINPLLDIERIEFMPGSQGSLYGRNTHSGTINITTKDPGNEFNAYSSVEYERFNTARMKAAFGGPANDVASYRLALAYNRSDGYIKNDTLNNKDSDFSEQFTSRGKFILENHDVGKLTLSMYADKFNAGFDSYGPIGKDASLHVKNDYTGYTRGYLLSPILTWEKDFKSVTVTSITNFSRSRYAYAQDWDFSSLDITTGKYKEDFKTLSQELRFNGGQDTDFRWLVGFYGLHEKIDTKTEISFGDDAGAWMMAPDTVTSQKSKVTTNIGSAFTQLIYTVTPHIEITGAARVDYEAKKLDWRNADNSGYIPVGKLNKKDSWFSFSPSGSIAWLFNKDKRVYATVAKGFKAGDFNNVMTEIPLAEKTVDPEKTITYELGYKGRHMDNRLELNAAIFHTTWDDMQVDVPSEVSPYGNYEKVNAGKAHATGIELSSRSIIMEGWDVFANVGYMFEYEFDEFKRSNTEDLKGKKLPYTNKYTVGLGTTYRHSSGFFMSADANLQGKKYLIEDNKIKEGDHLLVNAKIGYEDENWDVYVYGRNLLDERYAISAFNGAQKAGEPLVVGVQASVKF